MSLETPAVRESRLSFVQTQRVVVRLTVLIGTVLVCLALLWAWADRGNAVRQTKTEVANLARSLAEHTNDVLQEADTILVGLRERVRVDGTTPASLTRLDRVLALRAAALPLIDTLLIIGPNGDMLAGSVPVPPGGLNFADQPYFAEAKRAAGDVAVFGPTVRSKLDGSWIITVARRLTDAQGGFAGIALATISLDYFQHSYEGFDVGESGAIFTLVTTRGTIVARRPFVASNIGRDIAGTETFAHIAAPGAPTSFTFTPLVDGVTRIGGYHRVPRFPLLVVVARERGQALAGWRLQTATLLGEVTCVLLALAWTARRVVRQLGHMRLADRRLQRAHRRLLRSEARMAEGYRWLLLAEEMGHVGHWRVSLPDRTLSWSDEVFRIHGLPAAAGIDLEAALAAYHPEDRDLVSAVVEDAMADGTPLDHTARILRPNGEIRHVASRGIVQFDAAGRPVSLFGVLIDQTEQHRIEAALRQAQRETEAANARLNLLARQDGLTGIGNRRQFDEMLDIEHRRAARNATSLALIMIDVDHFKAFNDRYGHPQGDRVLQAIARVLVTTLRRPADLAVRYGGEELALLLPDTDAEGAYALAMRVVDGVRALRIPHEGSPLGVVTISAGVRALIPEAEQPGRETLLIEADRALYSAKCAGRSAAALFAPPETTQSPAYAWTNTIGAPPQTDMIGAPPRDTIGAPTHDTIGAPPRDTIGAPPRDTRAPLEAGPLPVHADAR